MKGKGKRVKRRKEEGEGRRYDRAGANGTRRDGQSNKDVARGQSVLLGDMGRGGHRRVATQDFRMPCR